MILKVRKSFGHGKNDFTDMIAEVLIVAQIPNVQKIRSQILSSDAFNDILK